jgi:hypothetical protein
VGEDADDNLTGHEGDDQRQREREPLPVRVGTYSVRVSGLWSGVSVTMLVHRA